MGEAEYHFGNMKGPINLLSPLHNITDHIPTFDNKLTLKLVCFPASSATIKNVYYTVGNWKCKKNNNNNKKLVQGHCRILHHSILPKSQSLMPF